MAQDRRRRGPRPPARSLPFVLFSFHGFWPRLCLVRTLQLCVYSGYSLVIIRARKRKKRWSIQSSRGTEKLYGDGKFVRRGRTRYSGLVLLSFSVCVVPGCVVLTIHGRISGSSCTKGGIRFVHAVLCCWRCCADSNWSPLCCQCVAHSTLSSSSCLLLVFFVFLH